MATTTNYGWTTPDDTALVKDGAAAIRSLGTAIDTTTYNNAQAAIAKTLIDAKGDLIVGSAADTAARLAVGTNDYVLTADSAATNGVKWAALPVAASGLTLITPTSTANTGGTVTTTGGKVAVAGSTSVSLNGVFSSTYDNYLIIVNGLSAAGGTGIGFRLRASGTDDTGNNYNWAYDSINGTDDGANNSNAWHSFGYGNVTNEQYGGVATVCNPFATKYTTGTNQFAPTDVAGGWVGGFRHAQNTSYDGFTIFVPTHALTFTVRVYGYAN